MMYLFDFVTFLFDVLSESLSFLGSIGSMGLDCCKSLISLVDTFPDWIHVPFLSLISIAILFRVSQFIPTIGGAS